MIDSLRDLLHVGERAAARHKRKVIDALKKGASDLILSEDIVTSNGGKTVRVRIKVMETPVFAFDHHDEPAIGIGEDAQPGEVVLSEDEEEGEEGEGSGAGNGGGREYHVTMNMDDLIELLMEAWGLPNLEAKKRTEIVSEDYSLSDIARKGPMSRVHKKRTLRNALKRAAATGGDVVIHNDDLRFRAPKQTFTYSSNAVIVLVRDRSGSMGDFEMKASRITSMWLVQFLRRRYDRVVIRFVLHDHAAEEVDENTFFHVSSGGGTQIAEAYRFAGTLLNEYPESEFSRYVVHFSDGDDWDVEASIKEMEDLLPSLQCFAYYEVDSSEGSHFSMFWNAQTVKMEDYPNFVRYAITSEDDVPDALREFLGSNE